MRALLCALVLAAVSHAGDADTFLKQARAALKKGDAAAALAAANKALAADPTSAPAFFTRGEVYAAQRKHAEAIKDFDAALALDDKFYAALNARGAERFKLGQIDESIADFSAYLKQYPKQEPGHWRRGISFYYAGKYAEGAKQFIDGQVEFGADVENVFWHFLCTARKDGIDKARKELLTLKGPDGRVPMMQVNDLLHGKLKPDDVIKTLERYGIKPRESATGPVGPMRHYISMRMENRGGAKEGTPELYFTDPDGLLIQLQDVSYCGGSGVLGEKC